MKTKVIGFAVICLLLFAGCQSQTTSVPSDNTENIIVEDTSREPQQETSGQIEEEEADVLSPEDADAGVQSPEGENIISESTEENSAAVEEPVKSLNYDVLHYVISHPTTEKFTGQPYRIFNNSALFFYKNAFNEEYIYAGSNCVYDDIFGFTSVGLELGSFINNMGESIAAEELSELLGIEIVTYDGIQAEPGYINWFGRTLYTRDQDNYVVYIYAPIENALNNETTLSSDSFIIFKDADAYIYFDPLKSKERNCWIDNTPMVYSIYHCPFIGLAYDSDGMQVYDDWGDGRFHIEYTDPESGWKYDIIDTDPSGAAISDYSYVDSITLTAGDLFPDMPETISYSDMAERYANTKKVIDEPMFWEKSSPDAYFAVSYWVDEVEYNEVDYLGVCLTIYSKAEQGYISREDKVWVYRCLQWMW